MLRVFNLYVNGMRLGYQDLILKLTHHNMQTPLFWNNSFTNKTKHAKASISWNWSAIKIKTEDSKNYFTSNLLLMVSLTIVNSISSFGLQKSDKIVTRMKLGM